MKLPQQFEGVQRTERADVIRFEGVEPAFLPIPGAKALCLAACNRIKSRIGRKVCRFGCKIL